jgi:superfamily I DNA/RNA helicase
MKEKEVGFIIGSAGTGKTKQLEEICEALLESYHPSEIAYISFANATIDTMVERFVKRKGGSLKDYKYFRTIHSLCYWLLKQKGYFFEDIADERISEFDEMFGTNLREFWYWGIMANTGELFIDNEMIQEIIDWKLARSARKNISNGFTEKWDKFKKECHYLDYFDVIDICIDNKWIPNIKVLIIDEVQDVSIQQYEYLKLLFPQCEKIYFAGDDDQQIYGFGGKMVDLQDIIKDTKADVITLGVSYRVKENILKFAQNYISQNVSNRIPKVVKSAYSGGMIEEMYIMDMLDGAIEQCLKQKDVIIISRCRYQLGRIKEWLEENNIMYYNPYSEDIYFNAVPPPSSKQYGMFTALEAFYNKQNIYKQDLLYLLELLPSNKCFIKGAKTFLKNSDRPYWSFDDLVFTPQMNGKILIKDEIRKIILEGKMEYLIDIISDNHKKEYERYLKYKKMQNSDRKVKLGTIHSVKGGEAEVVFLINEGTNKILQRLTNINDNERDDEYKVWYVGITRASEKLVIVNTGRKQVIY